MLGVLALFVTLVLWADPPFGSDERHYGLWLVYILLGVVMLELLVRLRNGLWPARLIYVLFAPMIALLILALLRVGVWPVGHFLGLLHGFRFILPFWALEWGIILPCYHYLVSKGGRRHPLAGSRELQAVLFLSFLLVIVMPLVLYHVDLVF